MKYIKQKINIKNKIKYHFIKKKKYSYNIILTVDKKCLIMSHPSFVHH
jgi:hypothetical protein